MRPYAMLHSALFVMLLASPSQAGERIAGPVTADVVEVLDGDSLRVRAHIWPGHFVDVILRVRGINTPELRASCPREHDLALAARDVMSDLVGAGPVALVNIGGGKYYGRILADIRLADGTDLAAQMLRRAPSRRYAGAKRLGWCAPYRNDTPDPPRDRFAVRERDRPPYMNQ